MLRKLGIIGVLIASSLLVQAQTIVVNQQEEQKGILFNSEWSIGARLFSNGWGFFFERAWIPNIRKVRYFRAEFQEIKDFREKKQSAELSFFGPGIDNPKDYFFGKQNQFYTFRFGYGQKKVLGDKSEKNGVRLALVYEGGVTLGFLKPYYLDLAYQIPSTGDVTEYVVLSQKYTEANKDVYLDRILISGASGWRYGFREIEPVPGGYGRVGLSFDWSSNDDFVKALEAGFQMDVFYKRIPMMIIKNQRRYYIGAYISFQFGKRWLKTKDL